jgi:CheY-like chemotaxis protein
MRIFALDDCLMLVQGYQARYGAEPFTDPYEMMQALRWEQPDLLITDLNLGRTMNGWDVVDAARRLYPDLPIIVATAYDDDVQKALAKIKGVDFWAKGGIDDLKTLRELVAKYGQLTRPDN